MGYNYTTQGWYKSDAPVDLSAIQPPGDQYDWANYDRPSAYARVTGRDRNYVVFATEAKYRGNYYLATLKAVMAAAGGRGYGLMTTTGEITYDGKDRFVIARDRALLTLPTARVYDPYSPWNAVYRWSHHMSRSVEKLLPAESAGLHNQLLGRTSIKGWLGLHDHQIRDDAAGPIISGIVARNGQLRDGIAFLSQLSEPYLLIGQDDVDPERAVAALAEVTATHSKSYGILYCAAPDERLQTPIAIEDGRVRILPAISLADDAEPDLLPTDEAAYEGLEHGMNWLPISFPLHLHGSAKALMRGLQAQAIEPDGGWRAHDDWYPPGYLFEAHGLTCFFTSNAGAASVAWPYELIVYLSGPANPDLLKQRVAELVVLLQAEGIGVGAPAL